LRRAADNRLRDRPIPRRTTDAGSGTDAADGRKSVALFTLPTTTEKLPVSARETGSFAKADNGIDRESVLGVEPAWFL
jgi:hypothetical protein